MNRRDFIKTGLILSSASLANTTFAAPQSSSKYDYRPIDYSGKVNEDYRITNDILPMNSKQQVDFWAKPRRIFLKRSDTGETSEIYYYNNGSINQKQYWLASYMLRDGRQQKMVYMDPELLDLICAVQGWLTYFNYKDPLLVLSGFRTYATNSSLEGAARNSMHLYGQAIDFRVPGLSINAIAEIADYFKAGGIGLYPGSNFIHLDTGGVRKWVGSSWNRRKS